MEAASLAVSIAALYTTCRDCYNFFTTVRTAGADSSAHFRELEIQQSILKAWGFHWEIQENDCSQLEYSDRTRQKRTKLHECLLSNPFKAEGVFKTLSALADTLSNQDKLIKRYGLQFQPVQVSNGGSQLASSTDLAIQETIIEDVNPVITEVKKRLSVLNKFKWALKDKDGFKQLIAELKNHGESLYRLCPEYAFASMNIYLAMDCLAAQESPAGLKSTSTLASQHAESDTQSSVQQGYRLLASAASLKACINQNRVGEQVDGAKLVGTEDQEEQHEMQYLGQGLALYKRHVVYIEMRDYRGPPSNLTSEQKQQIQQKKSRRKRARFLKSLSTDDMMSLRFSKLDVDQSLNEYSSDSDYEDDDDEPVEIERAPDVRLRALIQNFYSTFHAAKMRENVYGLDIAGMIDHTEGEHKGFCSILYKLPGTVGFQSRQRPAENLKLRSPVTLQLLLGTYFQEGMQFNPTLGARFELARKLVHAVCLLHISGWLHRNIRAESVMFFPKQASSLHGDDYDINTEIDVSKPTLMGYIFSRPDDIVYTTTTTTTRSVPETEDSPTSHPERGSLTMWNGPQSRLKERKLSQTPYGRNMSANFIESEKTQEINIRGFTLDYYQHPAKHADPMRLYRHAYDVYSLGILLLEIGLWQRLISGEEEGRMFEGIEDQYKRRRWVCRDHLPSLRWRCGDRYADVVLSCLMIDSTDDEMGRASERELCAKIVADLEGCRA